MTLYLCISTPFREVLYYFIWVLLWCWNPLLMLCSYTPTVCGVQQFLQLFSVQHSSWLYYLRAELPTHSLMCHYNFSLLHSNTQRVNSCCVFVMYSSDVNKDQCGLWYLTKRFAFMLEIIYAKPNNADIWLLVLALQS